MAYASRMDNPCHAASGAVGQSSEQYLRNNRLSIRTDWLEGCRAYVLYVTGNIDWTTVHDLRPEIARCLASDSPSQLIVDLEGVDRVDSSGMGILLEGWQNANKNGIHFALSGINTSVRRVLERIRLDTIVEIRPTPEEALLDVQLLGNSW